MSRILIKIKKMPIVPISKNKFVLTDYPKKEIY